MRNPRHSPRSFGLAELLGVRDARRFVRVFWPERLFVHHASRSRVADLLSIPQLRRGRRFLAAWKAAAHAWPPAGSDDPIERRRGRKLRDAYDAGRTIYCTEVERQVPALKAFVRRLEQDLGLRHGDVTCQAILSRAGHDGQTHFDADCTFNLQLEGEKVWRVGRNDSVAYPHLSRRISESLPASMAAYAKRPFPARLPRGSRRFTTRPGSVVFLPHGCWHSTTCTANSFSLLFVLTGPKWYELFAREIERRLVPFAEARKLSLLGRDCDPKSAAKVLARLKKIVSRMEASDLVESWTGPPAVRYRRRDATIPSLGSGSDLAATLRWLRDAPETFEAADLLEAFPRRKESKTLRDLELLSQLKVIEAV